jgi:hypothetical protein
MHRGSSHIVVALAIVAGSVAGVQETAQQAVRPGVSRALTAQDSVLFDHEEGQWKALVAHDTTAFARLMGGGIVDADVSGIKRTSPSSVARYVLGCRTASYALDERRVTHFQSTVIITYKATVAATCWGQAAPSPLYVMTVYERRGDEWQPVAHSETPSAKY